MQSHVTYNLLKPQNENNQLPCTSRKFAIIAEFVHFFFNHGDHPPDLNSNEAAAVQYPVC